MLARRPMRALLAAIAAWAAGCFAASPFPEPVEVAAGVYVFYGAREEASRANRGHVSNQGFIVGPAGVIVIDSGPTAAFGAHMLAAIRARTPNPVALVVLTRPVDDAIFGATVFQQAGVPVLAHEAAAKLIAERCATCLRNLTSALGEDLTAGTRVPRPDRVFTGSRSLNAAGRSFELFDYSGAAAPGSIALWDPESGFLFAGGLASFERIPETRDAVLGDWVRALRDLARVPARGIVPAYGRAGTRADLDALAAYLGALDAGTARAYAARVSLLDAPRAVPIEQYRGWALYDAVHPRNVHHAYVARERQDLDGR
jgi:glyoxylase-like metal-dependent hydrolase (beta-lactamase superfamily II)